MPKSLEKVDVVVVGAGAAGSVYAAVLAESGKSVLVLERGVERKMSDLYSSQIWARRLKWASPEVTQGGADSIWFNFNAGHGFGGAAIHHYAVWPRMHPEDLREHTLYGRSLDWPFEYPELRPYYDQIQKDVGAIRSTANDLLTFLAANLSYTKTPLATAMQAMLEVRRPSGAPNLEIALGWHVYTADGKEIIWHNGATGGYRSFIGFDRKTRLGIVALSNTLSQEGVDDIGRHLLDEKVPLWAAPPEPPVVRIEPSTIDSYVGTYRLAPRASIEVTRQGDHLYAQKLGYALGAQTVGHVKVELLPENRREFFVHGLNVSFRFETDSEGRGSELIVREGSMEAHAPRVQ